MENLMENESNINLQELSNHFLKYIPPNPMRDKKFILFEKVNHAMLHVPDFSKICKSIIDAVVEEVEAEETRSRMNYSFLQRGVEMTGDRLIILLIS